MSPEQVFSIANLVALTGWAILILGARWRIVPALATGAILPLLFAILYGFLIAAHWGEKTGGFGTLAQVRALFSNEWLLLAGWVHYLAFDLFIGSWQVRDAQKHHIPHLLVIPGLILTFFFGPVGLLLYFIVRSVKGLTPAIDS
jgi:prepilin signal peptidase PulO-like enzyme (type II secretory pathway)